MSPKFNFGQEAPRVRIPDLEDSFVRMLEEGDSRPPSARPRRLMPVPGSGELDCGPPPPPLETIEYALERVLKAFRALDDADGVVWDAIDAPPRREKAFAALDAAAARGASVLEDFGALAFKALAAARALLEADTAARARDIAAGGAS